MPEITIDSVERIYAEDGESFTFTAYGTAEDGTGLNGYGNTPDAAVADLYANAEIGFSEETEPVAVVDYSPPELTPYVFALSLGSGLLTAGPDPLA